MDKYFDRMPLRAARIINRIIVFSGIAALLGAFILAIPDARRPASQMPWYFWILVLYLTFIPLYTPPARLGIATAGIPGGMAWFYIIFAAFVVAAIIFAAVFLPMTAMLVVILALAVSYALRGAQALLRKRRQSNHAASL
ncbi:MAG TPA: hypothetical protein VF826_00560 [Chloroflexia bacterium]|jgi:Flp pilus assembly protein TadB